MKNLSLFLLAVCILLLPAMNCPAANNEFILVNSPYPPFVMPEGHPLGPGIDMEVAIRVLQKLGIRPQVRRAPFKRVLAMLEDGSADMTTTLSFRRSRDAYLRWSTPYRNDTTYVFFTRNDSAFTPRKLEDLRGRTVGMARGFAFPEAFMQDGAIDRREAPHMRSLVGMLLEGRFDAIIVNSLAGCYELRETGRMKELHQAPFTIRTPDDAGTFMGFSRKRVPPDLVRRFNTELERMKASGILREIELKYLR